MEREVLSVIAKSCMITSKESPSLLVAVWRVCGGVKHISGLIYKGTLGVLMVFLENVIRDADTYTTHPICY